MKLNGTMRVHDKANRLGAIVPISSPSPIKSAHDAIQHLVDEDGIVRRGALDDGPIKDEVPHHSRRAQFVGRHSGSLLLGESGQN